MWLSYASLLIISYFIGCFHGSVLAQKLSGVNLKQSGVNNAGASNATIVLGLKYGVLVGLIDIGKGILAVLLAYGAVQFFSISVSFHPQYLFSAGAAVIIGHIFPFYMRFNGGKGTATLIGVLLTLDWRFGLLALALFLIVTFVTDYIVIGVLMLYISLLALAIWNEEIGPTAIACLLFVLAIIKHIENFKRIRAGTEKKVSAVLKKKK